MNKIFGFVYEVIFNMLAGAMIALKCVGMSKLDWFWTIVLSIGIIFIGYWMKNDLSDEEESK